MNGTRRDPVPSERLVRHVFWKYPIISVVAIAVVAAIAATMGSPNAPRATISQAATSDPGGAFMAFTQELDGTASSYSNIHEYGMGNPAEIFALRPLRDNLPILGRIGVDGMETLGPSDIRQAVATYDAASSAQRIRWASAYDKALGNTVPAAGGGGMGGMGAQGSPDIMKIPSLTGNFGPVPAIVEADVALAQNGYMEEHLQAVEPGHSFHLVNIWLYDHPGLLNTATSKGLTDDQWGMVKERGFAVGPWYLAIPAVFHIYFPKGSTGTGFVLWNLAFVTLLLFAVPLVPGVRNLPKRLRLYRFIYRYPRAGELDEPALRERHGPVHGGA